MLPGAVELQLAESFKGLRVTLVVEDDAILEQHQQIIIIIITASTIRPTNDPPETPTINPTFRVVSGRSALKE